MIIGVPREIQDNENRVSVTPAGVLALCQQGHRVLLEQGAGVGSGFSDEAFVESGAEVIDCAAEIFDAAEMILKVKEPGAVEYEFLRKGQILFTFLHLAASGALTKILMDQSVTAIGYETVQSGSGDLPLLKPMSEVAGRAAVQIGAHLLERPQGGRGILLGGVPGVAAAEVVIIGGGVVGMNAAEMAIGLGAQVTILDIDTDRLRLLENIYGGRINKLMSNSYNISESVKRADLLIGAVLIPGAKAPHLVSEEMVKTMKAGSVIVDVAIDQGGIVETIDHVTTHSHPTYVKHGVIHYSVGNMPGIVPRTSTIALSNVTLGYVLELAEKGFSKAVRDNEALARGVNVYQGHCTCNAVAQAHGLPFRRLSELI